MAFFSILAHSGSKNLGSHENNFTFSVISPSYELKELDDQTKEDLKKLNYLKELDYPNDEQDELWKKHTDNVRMSDMGYDDSKSAKRLVKLYLHVHSYM